MEPNVYMVPTYHRDPKPGQEEFDKPLIPILASDDEGLLLELGRELGEHTDVPTVIIERHDGKWLVIVQADADGDESCTVEINDRVDGKPRVTEIYDVPPTVTVKAWANRTIQEGITT